MPVRSSPLSAITAEQIESLGDRAVREDHTLEYKRDLKLSDRQERSEFLKDVVAFANAAGGTLLYGIDEGKGEMEGQAVSFPGLEINPDATHLLIDSLLRDGIDDRIPGVFHRAVSRADGRFFYVVRVPPSPLAPHMVTIGQHSWRFYLRGNAGSSPMSSSQIKQVALRSANAFDRVESFLQERRRFLFSRAAKRFTHDPSGTAPVKDQVVLHVVPLLPTQPAWAFSDEAVRRRLQQVPALGTTEPYDASRFRLDGMYSEFEDLRHVAFLRNGALEFQRYEVLQTRPNTSAPLFPAWFLEQDVLLALDQCAGLHLDGLLPLPCVVALSLHGVYGSVLLHYPRGSPTRHAIEDDSVPLSPIVITDWDSNASRQVRALFDEMYQAWGLAEAFGYGDDGEREWYDHRQRIKAPSFQYWSSAG
jgi:hypothetical protein